MRMYLVGAACVTLAACATTGVESEPSEPYVDIIGEVAALMAADRAWSAAVEASPNPDEAFVSFMESDAVSLTSGAPRVDGREAISAQFYELARRSGFSVAWEPSEASVSDDASLGYTIGSYEMTVDDANGYGTTEVGKYLAVWRKQPDGSWRVAADASNSDGPAIPSAK
ncbi:MAG: DUF4440 domain-containing protein [Caulobacterales bacterium]|nr:DUF4440 domain-containing protein [Caulobacterales bacterium]